MLPCCAAAGSSAGALVLVGSPEQFGAAFAAHPDPAALDAAVQQAAAAVFRDEREQVVGESHGRF